MEVLSSPMSTSEAADDVLVPVQLSSPGTGEMLSLSRLLGRRPRNIWNISTLSTRVNFRDKEAVRPAFKFDFDFDGNETSESGNIMSTSKVADDLLVPVQISSPGTGENYEDNRQRVPFFSFEMEKVLMPLPPLPEVAEAVKMISNGSLSKSIEQVNINIDGNYCQNKEAAGTASEFCFGTGESDRTNLQRSFFTSMEEVYTSLKQTREASGKPFRYGRFLGYGDGDATAKFCLESGENDKIELGLFTYKSLMHEPSIQDVTKNMKSTLNYWPRNKEDRFLKVLLMVSSFLLSFATTGAFYFIQALGIVGSHDPILKHSLTVLNSVFAASFFCNFLGVFILLVLQSRREYHQFKKFILIISNSVSFLFMVLGYGLLISFNIQRR